MSPPSSRNFIAIPIPSSIQTQISHFQKQLARRLKNRPFTWERPEKLHLTVTFLGHLLPFQQQSILQLLDRLSPPTTPLIIDSLGSFKKPHTDIIIFLRVSDPQYQLKQLHQKLTNQLLQLKISSSLKFHPHITIARVKPRYRSQIGNLSQLHQIPIPDFHPLPLKLSLWSSRFNNQLNTTTYSLITN